MRNPVRARTGGLLFTRDGGAWGLWRLQPQRYGHAPLDTKQSARTAHTALLRQLPRDSLLLGCAVPQDPVEVVERMLDGLDVSQHPEWAAECAATLDVLDELPLSRRSYWLSAPLPLSGTRRAVGPGVVLLQDLEQAVTGHRWVPTPSDVREARRAAAAVTARIPTPFGARLATAAESAWLQVHSARRGLTELPLPDGDRSAAGGSASLDPAADPWIRSEASHQRLLLDEGGQADLPPSRFNPLTRRFLKVTDVGQVGVPPDDAAGDDGGFIDEDRDDGDDGYDVQDEAQPDNVGVAEASYQVLLTLDDVPPDGMAFPGGEFLGRLDESGVDADWAIRLRRRSSEETSRRIKRNLRNLNDQYDHQDEGASTGHHDLDASVDALRDLEQTLARDRNEVAIDATIMFITAGPTAVHAQEDAAALAAHFAGNDYRLGQPVGAQEALWWSTQPGSPFTAHVRQLAQIATGADLAASVPLAGAELGDRNGALLSLNITTGRHQVTLLDLDSKASVQDTSPAVAVAGELGAGKSVALKTIAAAMVARGGRLLCIDRTSMGEWSLFAEGMHDSVTVQVLRPTYSLDPLRLLPGRSGPRVAQSFLSTLLNIAPATPEGALLSDVLEPSWLAERGVSSLGDIQQLLPETGLPGAVELAARLRTFARKDLGQVLFDPTLPPVPLDAPAIVFGTAGLQLPSHQELTNEHLFRQMRLERIYGRAIYTLVMGLIRHIAFADPSELVVVPLDEAHHVTSSPEAEQEVIELIRDGRKHKAAVLLGLHDPTTDFGSSDTLSGLIPTRLVMRHTDPTLAAASLRWLGVDPEESGLLDDLMRDTSPVDPTTGSVPLQRRGEGFMRDSQGRLGKIKVLVPADPTRASAVLTTPRAGTRTTGSADHSADQSAAHSAGHSADDGGGHRDATRPRGHDTSDSNPEIATSDTAPVGDDAADVAAGAVVASALQAPTLDQGGPTVTASVVQGTAVKKAAGAKKTPAKTTAKPRKATASRSTASSRAAASRATVASATSGSPRVTGSTGSSESSKAHRSSSSPSLKVPASAAGPGPQAAGEPRSAGDRLAALNSARDALTTDIPSSGSR